MRKLFGQKKGSIPTEPTPSVPEGWTLVQPAAELLLEPHRQRLVERIWQYTALSPAQFEQLYRRPLSRYAEYVQLLPASESHHHAYAGGMLDHGLELVATALKLRQSHLLPATAAPEDQAVQADAWSAAIAYGALLHDIGKVAVDLEVECINGQRWHPWHGPLEHPYRFRYVSGRDYKLHNAAAGLVFTQILNPDILDWLSVHPTPWCSLLYVLAGQYEHAGVLGELVTQADRISTAQNIGGNPAKALQAPVRSLQHHLLSALRHLVKNELKLNQAGAAGWLTDDALWLVSKVAADKIRAHLLAQSVDSVPSSNIALFDELQSHGLIEANSGGKAIWKASVVDGDWRQTLTFLRLQPSLIWGKDLRPDAFTGNLQLDQNGAWEESKDVAVKANSQDAVEELKGPPASYQGAIALVGYPRAIDKLDMAARGMPQEADPLLGESASISAADLGQKFLVWVRDGITSHRLVMNDSKAKVHTVNDKLFVSAP